MTDDEMREFSLDRGSTTGRDPTTHPEMKTFNAKQVWRVDANKPG
jgi:hypothetical protein